ncbi:MAG: hypothetical protein R2715_08255 [Ilumatobacteraceae bacterium]
MTAGSFQSTGSIRNTSAPSPARNRVATGPASTRVRSRTRTPANGRSGVPLAPDAPTGVALGCHARSISASAATAAPWGCRSQSPSDRIAAAQPPASTTADSASAAAIERRTVPTASRSGAHPNARNIAARWWEALVWSLIQPSAVG